MKLSVVLATRNEQENIGPCLKSVRGIADEIIVMDERSTDRTKEIAESFGAKVYEVKHEEIFHKTKQKALEKATGDWILQLDADERVTPKLAREVKRVLGGKVFESKNKLFGRHQKSVEKLWGKTWWDEGEVVAYFIPRINMFLGKPLIHAGVYPDGVVRLFKNGRARFPAKSVHEIAQVDGRVGWLTGALTHHDSPTLRRYLARANRYTSLTAQELQTDKTLKNLLVLFVYSFIKPLATFLKLYFRHKGFLDGMRGFLWSFFSALHFPIAYWTYWVNR